MQSAIVSGGVRLYRNAACNYVCCCVQIYHTNIMPIQLLTRVDAFHRHSYHCLIALPICADLEFQKPTEFK